MDFLACLLCVVALGLSLWLVIKSKCYHLEWDYCGGRCQTCGVSSRELRCNGETFLRNTRFIDLPNPYVRFGMYEFVRYRIEEDPTSDRMRSVEYVTDDAPKIVKEQHAEMMKRREGLAWLKPIIWKDCV